MEQLYEAVFKRFEGRSDDGIFKLTQAMGGGKTHNMIAIGLLASFPEFREKIMGTVYKSSLAYKARVIAFSGSQSTEFGIWGAITELKTPAEAQRAPSPYAVFNLVYNGRLLVDHSVSETRLMNILKTENLIRR